jgi:AsmA protein
VVSGVLGPVAQALPFARAQKESKAEGTSLGKELPFSIRVADGVARLEKPLEVKQAEADVTFEGGVTLRGEMDMPTTVALSPQTIASLTGGAAKPSAPIPVRFRLTGPFSSPTMAGLDVSPVLSAVLKEAGGGILGKALGAPSPPSAPGQPGAQPGQAQPEDPTKRLEEEARKRLRDLLGR